MMLLNAEENDPEGIDFVERELKSLFEVVGNKRDENDRKILKVVELAVNLGDVAVENVKLASIVVETDVAVAELGKGDVERVVEMKVVVFLVRVLSVK